MFSASYSAVISPVSMQVVTKDVNVLWHAGGLTENDFVMASKINLLDFTDLQQKKKARTYFF